MANNYGYAGAVPNGVSIQNNINEALAYQATHNMLETLFWFKSQVQNHGLWDYKQQSSIYENFGNFNYGVIGAALGYPDSLLLSAAGGAQLTSYTGGGTPAFALWTASDYALGRVPFAPNGLFDDPKDRLQIQNGMDAMHNEYERNNPSWTDIFKETVRKRLNDASDYLNLTNGEQQIIAAMLIEDQNGMHITLDDRSMIYLASNSLEGLGNVISGTRTSSDGNMLDSNNYFLGGDGTILGNIKAYDPSTSLLPQFTSMDSVSSLLESFQQTGVLSGLEAAGIYGSSFLAEDGIFRDFLAYSWDDKYGDNDIWNESSNGFTQQDIFDSNGGWGGGSMSDIATVTNAYFGASVINGGADSSTSINYVIYANNSAYNDWASSVNSGGIGISGGINSNGFNFTFGFSFPVALDLDNDGVELTSVLDSTAWFDVTGDGSRHQTGWVGADDALLAYDENGDGCITTARELAFASRTIAVDTDLEALKSEFDTNTNGLLDSGDADYGKFRIWQDKDSDGESDAGELMTMSEAGIVSLNLIGAKTGAYAIDGNQINAFTTYTKSDGTVGMGADVALGYDSKGFTATQANGYMIVKQTGDTPSSYAMATTATALNINLATLKLDGAIGGVANDTLDASTKTSGVMLDGKAGSDILKGGSGNDWLDGGDGVDIMNRSIGSDTYIVDDARELAYIKEYIDDGADTIKYTGSENITFIDRGIDYFYSGSGNDIISHISLDYQQRYISSSILIDGGAGDDTIAGHIYSDLLIGGTGNDTLNGNSGNDTYVYNKGDGADTIAERGMQWVIVSKHHWYEGTNSDVYGWIEGNGGIDTIEFGDSVTIDNLDIKLIGNDLLIGVRDTGDVSSIETLNDRILIKDFLNGFRTIENLSFSDGTTTSLAAISGLNIGTSSNDTIVGLAGNDIINSKAGADKLSGGIGNDVFIFDTVFSVQEIGLTTVTFGSLSISTYGMIEKSNGNIDTISDFEAGEDIIYLDNTIFKQLSDGSLGIDNFVTNNTGKSQDANDYIVYNTFNGNLSYDIDGNGKGMSVVFATLSNKPIDLSYSDFMVI